ncbi:elongation of very long chain fatty acids protein AAEL008004-like isoform X2 [Cimex lectularius]|uniref:Elongation of very long chain fatty acids protein n=1 Tax=Cimex lectularius TaxID=79782 RepID=A0A8I6TL41_CIMLE|nr:elongation of very long chain fatty acids protein AAEL008004-like isoform X2 [Cimex lectularius]
MQYKEVDNWFLMGSPIPIVVILSAYLYFVLKLGPKIMEKRKPFELKMVLVGYNLYQVVFSSWVVSQVFDLDTIRHLYKFACVPQERHLNKYIELMNVMSWWYFFSKVIELLDTVFFVLRKKQNQVSVLHVYHHSNMLVSTWAYLKFIRGEQAIIPGLINSFVHVVMYSYYLLAALGPSVQKYLWWKKYITKLQLGQFVVILIYLSSLLAFDCNLPRGLTIYMSATTVTFLILFLNFYQKSYAGQAKKVD